MRYILFLLAVCGTAHAEEFRTTSKPVNCSGSDYIFEILKEKYQEEPVLFGVNSSNKDKSAIVMLVNEEHDTWTLVETNRKVACILAAGKGLDYPDSGIKTGR